MWYLTLLLPLLVDGQSTEKVLLEHKIANAALPEPASPYLIRVLSSSIFAILFDREEKRFTFFTVATFGGTQVTAINDYSEVTFALDS